MKKMGFMLVAIVAIAVGLLVGTLNSGPVQLNLLWIQFELSLGLVVLLGFSFGLVTGLSMIYLFRVLPLRHQLRKARLAALKQERSATQDSPGISLPDA